jgi:hypothetical protein
MNWQEGLLRIALSIKVIGVLGGMAIIIGGLINNSGIYDRLGFAAGGFGFAIVFYGVGWILDGFARPNK